MSRGFTLVEVLVALVVVGVGLVGVAGTLHLAAAGMGRAEGVERAVEAMAAGLAAAEAAGAPAGGATAHGWGTVHWRAAPGGVVTVEAHLAGDTLRAEGWVAWPPAPAR